MREAAPQERIAALRPFALKPSTGLHLLERVNLKSDRYPGGTWTLKDAIYRQKEQLVF